MKILSIESSCDETAAAVIEDGRKICSSVIHTQVEEHKLYGGVVPEIASRRHIESICGVTAEALEQAGLTAREVDAVAVTAAPGLIGAVLVGVNFAKGLALSAEKPLIPVHHIRGHVAANYLTHPELEPPFLALIVSGGHSHIVLVRDYCDYTILGRTTDDAAGEAFDKAARCVGLPYPGGVALDAPLQRYCPAQPAQVLALPGLDDHHARAAAQGARARGAAAAGHACAGDAQGQLAAAHQLPWPVLRRVRRAGRDRPAAVLTDDDPGGTRRRRGPRRERDRP